MFVSAAVSESGTMRRSCDRPFSPTAMTLIVLFSSLSRALMVRRPRATAEWTPPHRPLSDEMATTTEWSARPAVPSRSSSGVAGSSSTAVQAANCFAAARRFWSPLSFAAETIFIDDVIFRMFLVEAMRIAISFSVAMDRRAAAIVVRGASALAARRAMVIFVDAPARRLNTLGAIGWSSFSSPARSLAWFLARSLARRGCERGKANAKASACGLVPPGSCSQKRG